MIDVIASEPHFVDHLAPAWRALPETVRGVFFARSTRARDAAERHGVSTVGSLPEGTPLTLVASVHDYRIARARGRSCVYLNHGVGQAWRKDDGSLVPAGAGMPKPGVRMFLTPGPFASSVTREANLDAWVREVGSPKLDAHLNREPPSGPPIVVFSTHWDQRGVPEARGTLGIFMDSIMSLRSRQDFAIAFHAHPLAVKRVTRAIRRANVPYFATFDEVLERASAYVTDSSSTLFEAAAVGIPVVALNAPWYRREHHHGLRFWEAAGVGVNVDAPEMLEAGVLRALANRPEDRALRRKALELAYAPLDGRATERAVAGILDALAPY